MATDSSLKKRFTFKLVANVLGVLLGLVTMAFVPRALGPENFGRFEFVTNNFKLILETVTLQVPVAYFNWVSRKGHKEETDVASGITLYFSLAMTGVFALFIAASIAGGFHAALWPEIEPLYLWYSLAFTLAVFLYQLLVYLSDGKSLTVGLEKIRLLQNVLKTTVLVGLVLLGWMNLSSYFLGQTAVIAFTVVLSAAWLRGQGAWGAAALKSRAFPRDEVKRFVSFVREFARPLTLLMLSGFLFLYFDRWFLQLIGGSVQQGFFGLSDRLGQIAFIFTSAMTPLLTREFAFAHEEQNRERMVALFQRIRLFLFIAAVTSCFLSVQSAAIVQIIGGEKFRGAVVPIALMALYPIHQTFGQLSGTFLVATGQTGLYAKIGILMMVVSLPITYFLIAPASYLIPGLALGATGLAIKMLVWQAVGTNLQLYFNTRYLGIPYLRWIGIQVALVGVIYLLAYASASVAGHLDLAAIGAHVRFPGVSAVTVARSAEVVVSGLMFLAMVAALFMAAPGLAGVGREEITHGISSLLKR